MNDRKRKELKMVIKQKNELPEPTIEQKERWLKLAFKLLPSDLRASCPFKHGMD